MSDHEETPSDSRYDTPVPELDDHRNRTASTVRSDRPDRPRRGTFDSLYGARHIEGEPNTPVILVRDFEEAIIDEETADLSPTARRNRRPTVDTMPDGRSISPPNSVKAFAEARRREREMSFSEARPQYDEGTSRAMSISSRRSLRSRPHTTHTIDNDAASFATNKTAEEDVCFPLQENQRKDQLHIDFDFLEGFITEQTSRTESRPQSAPHDFDDMRPQSTDSRPTRVATIDGDIYDLPSDDSMAHEKGDKAGKGASETTEKAQLPPIDHNRFSFFSSAWESTIHAAEMGDLVLPGEDIRGLFELPEDETDGVWWLNVNSASKDEVLGICKAFGIHPLTIEDIITQEAREKIELFPSYYFACFRSFNIVEEPEGKEYEPFNIYVIVFREGTLSFSFAPNTHASQVRKRITALKDYVALSSDWICYALM